jgi:uncharacterized membrane protein
VYDNAENGVLMPIEKYFGKKLADRIRPPKGTWADQTNSSSLEECYFNLDDYLKAGPCIYIVDSMDSLVPEEDEEKFDADKALWKKGKKPESGSFGTKKARVNSSMVRMAVGKIEKSKSILIVVSQTRSRIGPGATYDPKTVSGGNAMKFYCHQEMWTSVRETLKKNVNGTDRVIGNKVRVKIKKNRLTGYDDVLHFTFYKRHGIDDVGSTIDFLVEEKVWKKAEGGSSIDTGEFGLKGSREKLVQQIETQGLERKLRKVAGRAWDEIQEACKVQRKKRYE